MNQLKDGSKSMQFLHTMIKQLTKRVLPRFNILQHRLTNFFLDSSVSNGSDSSLKGSQNGSVFLSMEFSGHQQVGSELDHLTRATSESGLGSRYPIFRSDSLRFLAGTLALRCKTGLPLRTRRSWIHKAEEYEADLLRARRQLGFHGPKAIVQRPTPV